jgi:hypothetical protein
MYYEYFHERAAASRRSAEGAEGWLSDVSSEMADMFEEMAEDSLTRELSRQHKPLAPEVPKMRLEPQPSEGMPVRQGSFWRRVFFGRARRAPRFIV